MLMVERRDLLSEMQVIRGRVMVSDYVTVLGFLFAQKLHKFKNKNASELI